MQHRARDINAAGAPDISPPGAVRNLYGTCPAGTDRVDTAFVRIVAAALSLGILAAAAASPSGAVDRPAIRLVAGPELTIAGTGFAPRATVRVRVDVRASETVKTAVVRTGGRGGFVVRFAGLEPCSPREVTATGAGGLRARIPAAWFVRECPPGPPPLAPSPSVSS